uniref:Leucine-rich repeat flightless-interacting protein 2 n=1 Tax=Neogobius melanostomus TaxID=47308 RepID=A0A8C6S3T2_9GOBI
MGTQGTGRKRAPLKDRFSAEDEALSSIAREAEARLAAKRAARAEARDIRMRELERQQKEVPQLVNQPGQSTRNAVSIGVVRNGLSMWEGGETLMYPYYLLWLSALAISQVLIQKHTIWPFSPSLSDTPLSASLSHKCSVCGSQSSDFSDISESAADYFSRSNRRGSIVSDLDDLADLDIVTVQPLRHPRTVPCHPGLFGGTSSRRGSTDTGSIYEPDTNLTELRDSLVDVEEKYKKAMVSNAQLDNNKANLIYQTDTLKDVIEELEEQSAEMKRELEDKTKELERQKHLCTVLQHKQEELKEGLRQRDELIEKHGLVIIPDGTPNGDVNHEPLSSGLTVVSQEAAQVLESAGEGPLDVRLRKLADEKDELLAQIRKLKNQLDEEKQKHSKNETFTDGEGLENGTDLHFIEMQRDANRQISEYKFKLSKAEQEMGTMEQNINRLEGQVSRYKAASDNAEKIEDELKAEKRKLQRELRTALDKIEEMEMTNNHLVKRLEKMKANRNALLSQQ